MTFFATVPSFSDVSDNPSKGCRNLVFEAEV
jgi:hypothetical protein